MGACIEASINSIDARVAADSRGQAQGAARLKYVLDPLVSVIMPAFDAQNHLPDAAASLVGQSYSSWELLVVSDDWEDYRDLLPKDERIRFFRSPHPGSGPAAARNAGLSHARGDLVGHLDADDLYHPERLMRLVPLAMRCGMALDNMRILDYQNGSQIALLFDRRRKGLDFEEALDLNHPIFPLCRRSLIGQWDEDIPFAEDVLFNLRAISRISQVPVLNEPMMDYRVRSGSVSCSERSCLDADEAYSAILKRLEKSDFGFCPSKIDSLRRMFERKAELNRTFLNLKGKLGIKSFAEYASILDAPRKVQQNIACS